MPAGQASSDWLNLPSDLRRGSRTPKDNGFKRQITPKQVGAILLVVLAIVFVAEYTRSTKIRFIGPAAAAPLWVALLVPLVLGFAAGALFMHRRRP